MMGREAVSSVHKPALIGDPIAAAQPGLPDSCLAHLPMGVAIIDPDFILQKCNAVWADFIARYNGSSPSQVMPGINVFDLLPQTTIDFASLFKQALAGETVRQAAFRLESEGAVSYWDLVLAPFDHIETVKIVNVVTQVPDSATTSQEREQHMANDRLYRRARTLATMEERDRLARELHDSVAQALGYLNLQISITSRLLAEGQIEEAETNLQELKQVASKAYTDLREEIFSLRAKVSSGAEFLSVLRDYLHKYQTYYGLEVELLLEDGLIPEFSTYVAGQVLRIVQEALINVRKHAQVKGARLRYARQDDKIAISVEDSGRGFDVEAVMRKNASSFGLQIMRERVESIGGKLEVESEIDQGSRLTVLMPVQAKK